LQILSFFYHCHFAFFEFSHFRFAGEENGAQKAWDKAVAEGADGKVIFQEKELTGKVLEGEDEEKYWSAFNASKQNKMDRASGRRGGRGGRGRGGHGGPRGQKRQAEEGDAPKSKKIIFDDDGKPSGDAPSEAKTAEA
ncbi:hypothetical protein COOONC_02520, partial [Cooperia oncophora]